jgi:DMSO/TMAO reductase YedYZ heme-binding membrane subunit
MDNIFKETLWWSLGVLAMLILVFRIVERIKHHWRHLAAMNLSGEAQSYWRKNQSSWWKVKKHILYAPLGKKRHNREIRLSSAMNMGTIPSRFHTILLGLYLLSNFAYCVTLNYGELDKYSVAAELRGRAGVLAVVNMIALVILAGRNNPLITLLQISFDTYNLLHRWMGRIIVLEAVVHTLAWAYVKHAATGWSGIGSMLTSNPFISWGTVGIVSMLLILITSFSPVRHAFYETFLNVHIILAFIAMITVYIHCHVAKLPQVPYIQAVILLWLADRIARMTRILYCNWSRKGWTNASVTALPGGATRVTMHLPRYLQIEPGTHAYLRFATLNTWESHPFSIAWVDHRPINPSLPNNEKDYEESAVMSKTIDPSETTTDVSFIIHSQTGLTKRLFDKANLCRPRTLTLKAAFEGPYAGHHSLDSYGHTVLFAGSSGISHQIPYVRHLIQGFDEKMIATRKICLVWIVRDNEHLEWVRPWMDLILRMPGRRDILTIKLFVTRPKNPREIHSPSATVQMFPGRPNVKLILENEVKEQVGAMCVTVCGPGGLADNVREAVREVQEQGVVDFIEESFTW